MTPKLLLEKIGWLLKGRVRRYKGLRGRGQEWERLAEKHLKAAGYKIRERNFATHVGEIDFVAEEAGVLCFVEVKGRQDTGFGHPSEAVISEKQRRIYRSAEAYLLRRRIGAIPCRFDVVTILGSGPDAQITILRNAFQGPAPRRSRVR
jgi:putative endonuclease